MIRNTKLRVLFFGSSEYCLPVVNSLNNNFQLVVIITKKHQAVEKLAQKLNIPTFTPKDKKELITFRNKIHSLKPDLAIVSDYGLMIPEEIFTIPKYKTINIHFSRLPDLRGASPVQYTILRGDANAWITVQLLDVGLDTGDIISQKAYKLDGDETTDSLYKKLFNIAGVELPDIISGYVQNDLKPIDQDHSKATYSKILTREDGYIPFPIFQSLLKGEAVPQSLLIKWNLYNIFIQLPTANHQLSTFIEHAIRAFSPWPGVWTTIQITDNRQQITTKRLKILKVQLHYASRHTDVVGKMHKSLRLVIDKVQLEGKNPVSWKQFLEGHPNAIFEVQP